MVLGKKFKDIIYNSINDNISDVIFNCLYDKNLYREDMRIKITGIDMFTNPNTIYYYIPEIITNIITLEE